MINSIQGTAGQKTNRCYINMVCKCSQFILLNTEHRLQFPAQDGTAKGLVPEKKAEIYLHFSVFTWYLQ